MVEQGGSSLGGLRGGIPFHHAELLEGSLRSNLDFLLTKRLTLKSGCCISGATFTHSVGEASGWGSHGVGRWEVFGRLSQLVSASAGVESRGGR